MRSLVKDFEPVLNDHVIINRPVFERLNPALYRVIDEQEVSGTVVDFTRDFELFCIKTSEGRVWLKRHHFARGFYRKRWDQELERELTAKMMKRETLAS
jgi:ATP/maltotriose-dependent transcriptional regulator MalT